MVYVHTGAATKELAAIDALGSSLDLRVALERAYPLLLQLVSAEYGALGVADPSQPLAFEWLEANLPPAFFADYSQLAPHDFVRDAVATRPGVVLRDHEMLDRRIFEQHFMYRHAREVGAPIERVMAVMLPVGVHALSGLAVYRDRGNPFSDHEQFTLQQLTQSLTNTVRNCLDHERFAQAGLTVDALVESQNFAAMLVAAPARELSRSGPTSALLETWFEPIERLGGGVPTPLAAALAPFVTANSAPGAAPPPWQRRMGNQRLEVSFIPTSARTPRSWQLLFEVRFRPLWLEELTPREHQVLVLLCQGWDNQYIANELSCALGTVKKHVSSILRWTGMDRTMLAASQYSP